MLDYWLFWAAIRFFVIFEMKSSLNKGFWVVGIGFYYFYGYIFCIWGSGFYSYIASGSYYYWKLIMSLIFFTTSSAYTFSFM